MQSTPRNTSSRPPPGESNLFDFTYPLPRIKPQPTAIVPSAITPAHTTISTKRIPETPLARIPPSDTPATPMTTGTLQSTPRATPLTSLSAGASRSTPGANPRPSAAAETPKSQRPTKDDLYTFLTTSCDPPLPELYAPLVKYGIDMAYVHAISKWPEERIRKFVSGVKKRVQPQSQVKQEDMNVDLDKVVNNGIKPIQWDIFEHHVWNLGHKKSFRRCCGHNRL
ncbi:hypothetical protein BDN72DRAFT_339097 [Pluteus cervinus]|uniref:Uncharacterized protein n=1 Tax=Pluteus cervinus TaxID=181527 RepID=A0ACD3ABG3_9AGAR|nr:hypothetical protein BDN72DRAFT_339097 [Pluteus cervinus]